MINYKVINILGVISMLLGFSMLPSACWSLYYGEADYTSFLKSSLITILVGLFCYGITKLRLKEQNRDLQSIEGFTIVSLGWVIMGVFSALPFYFSDVSLSFVDSFFEAMSGLTTTGATILGNHILIEDLSHGLLFWRSFTQFIGGMGIIVFSIAILPLLGIGGVQLFKAEVAGPAADKMTPRIQQTAKL